jgi:hypothetical protein
MSVQRSALRRGCDAANTDSTRDRAPADVRTAPGGRAFVTALAVIALVWLAWVALWLIEQRW